MSAKSVPVPRGILAALIDALGVDVAEVVSRGLEVHDFGRIDPDDARTRGVHGRKIGAHGEKAQRPRLPHDGSVALHPDDRIDDRETRPQGGREVENRRVDAMDVQHIFRPAVHGAGHHAEEILHTAGHPGPVMSLELRQRDNQVGSQDRHRKRQRPHAGEPALQGHLAHIVVIQIHEADASIAEMSEKPTRRQ